jgi:superfamily I DNA/RNA helicase
LEYIFGIFQLISVSTPTMLDDEQKLAVRSSQFPLIITANAGSGKTMILLECAVEHIKLKQNARILILAFSRKAVAEIQQKLEKQTVDNQQVTVATFHSFAARLSRQHHSAAGFSKPPTVLSSYSNLLPHAERAWHKAMLHCLASALHMVPPSSTAITAETVATAFARHNPQHHHHHKEHYTCDEMIDHLNDICVKLKVHPYPEEACITFKNWAINHQMKPPLSSTSSHSPLFTKAADYLSLKLKQDAILTLSDLPSTALHLLKENPTVLEHVRRQYTHVFVDEFQDACKDQLELMVLLAPNVTIVGDPKQSIYGFRNALPNAMDNFYKMCIESRGYESAVVTLRRNYRSSPPICAFASELLLGKHTKLISARSTAQSVECSTATGGGAFPPVSVVQHQSGEEEAEAIADSIAQGISNGSFLPKNVAILYRCLNSNNNVRSSGLVEKALRKRNITYIVAMSAAAGNGDASHRDSQRKNCNNASYQEGKALLTYLQLIANPEDDSAWHAVLTLPHLGLTSDALDAISEMYRESILHQREFSMYNEIIQALASSDDMISTIDRLKLEQLHSLMVDLSRELSGGLNLQQFIMNVIFMAGLLNRRKDSNGTDDNNMSQGNEADFPTNGCTTTRSISSSPILAAILEEADMYSAAAHNQQLLHLAHPSLISILHSFLAYLSDDTDIVSEIDSGSCDDTEMMSAAGSTQGRSCIATTQALTSGTLADQNAVIITTMHSAKGLEWKAVYLPHVNKSMLRRGGGGGGMRGDGDGDGDGDEEDARWAYYEEEARLLHVAATRAEHYLSVSYVQKYYKSKEEYFCELLDGGSMNVPVVSPLLVPAIEKLKMQPHIMYFKGQLIATDDDDAYYSDDARGIMTFGTTTTTNATTNTKEDDGCVESRDRTNTGRVLSSTQVNATVSSSACQQQQPVAFKYKLASTARGTFKPPRPMHQ